MNKKVILLGLGLIVFSIVDAILYVSYQQYMTQVKLKGEAYERLYNIDYQNAIKDYKKQLTNIEADNKNVASYIKKREDLSILEIKKFIEYILPNNSFQPKITIKKDKNTFTYTSSDLDDILVLAKKLEVYKGKYLKTVTWDKITKNDELVYDLTVTFEIGQVRAFLIGQQIYLIDNILNSYYQFGVYNFQEIAKKYPIIKSLFLDNSKLIDLLINNPNLTPKEKIREVIVGK